MLPEVGQFLVSKWTACSLGVACLLSYSILIQWLPSLSANIHEGIPSLFNISWGIGAVIGLVLGCLMTRRMSSFLVFRASALAVAFVAMMFPVVLEFEKSSGSTSICGTCFLAAVLGVFISVTQLAGSCFTSSLSGDHLTAFFIGQSIAGLVPLPLMEAAKKAFFVTGSSPAFPTEMTCVGICLLMSGLFTLVTLIVVFSQTRGQDPKTFIPSPSLGTSILTVFESSGRLPLYAFLVTVVTFAVYPAQLVSWKPELNVLSLTDVTYQSLMIYLAIICDIVGLYLPRTGLGIEKRVLKLSCFLRILLVPIFAFSTLGVLYMDLFWVRIILVAILSTSGAFLFASIISLAESMVKLDQQETLGLIMSTAFAAGILVGSLCSHAIKC